jgi:hypothetical protein
LTGVVCGGGLPISGGDELGEFKWSSQHYG